MEILKDVLNTGRNVTGERLYCTVDTMEELYQKKTISAGTIMPDKKGLPLVLKTAKEQEVLSSKFRIIVQWC